MTPAAPVIGGRKRCKGSGWELGIASHITRLVARITPNATARP